MNQPTDEQKQLASRLFDKYVGIHPSVLLDLDSAWDDICDQTSDSVQENELESFLRSALLVGIQYGTNLAAELFTSTLEELTKSRNAEELQLMQKIIQNYRIKSDETTSPNAFDNQQSKQNMEDAK